MDRRSFVQTVGGGIISTFAPFERTEAAALQGSSVGRVVTIDAKPTPITIDTSKTAVIVVDMQNDFGAEGGMFHRAGLDTSMIRAAVEPTARVLQASRDVGMKVVYLKMAFRPDLSDAGPRDAPNLARHLLLGVGKTVRAPNGKDSRILIRDTWNTDILPELAPSPQDVVLYNIGSAGSIRLNWTQFSSVLV